jgi:hypothetical protein
MTTHSSLSPVSRETPAVVRDRGARAVVVTLTGGLLVLRAKGLRSRYALDVAWCYNQAVKQHVALQRREKKAQRSIRRQAGQVRPALRAVA